MTKRALIAALAVACSSAPLMSDLETAERAERDGDHPAALAAYERAQRQCVEIEDARRRHKMCHSAYLAHAELLDRMGRRREAAQAYERAAKDLAEIVPSAAEATLRAGRIWLELGEDKRAYTLLWKTVTDYPNEAYASDALKTVLTDGRRRNPQQVYDYVSGLLVPLKDSDIADNLLFAMAEVAEVELETPSEALRLYDRLAARYSDSGLRDDALWRGAALARTQKDPAGAVQRLRTLLATREVSLGTGSYFSVWLDDAQLELGLVLRDDLHDRAGAIAAFRALPEDYPDSVLRDEALFEEAATHAAGGDGPAACKVLASLAKKHPQSKFELEKAPALRAELSCAPKADAR